MNTVLAIIGFSSIAFGIIDAVDAHQNNKPGWALIWRLQAVLGSVLCGAALT